MVLGLGLGFKIMQKHLLAENELGSSLKKNIIIAGWIGFMMSLVLLGSGVAEEGENDNIGGGLAATGVSVLYGYMAGYTADAYENKTQKNSSKEIFHLLFINENSNYINLLNNLKDVTN